MKKQVLVIHGGDTFDTYEEWIEHLKKVEFKLDGELKKQKRWNRSLDKELGEDFEFVKPGMPNKYNAKYLEWKIWFDKVIPYVRGGVVIVGHSLGGTFIAKYLSENDFSQDIRAVYLVAAPKEGGSGESLADFVVPEDLTRFNNQVDTIFIYHSKDDPYVSFEESDKYLQALPKAKRIVFEDRGHFMGERFPELVESIKSLK